MPKGPAGSPPSTETVDPPASVTGGGDTITILVARPGKILAKRWTRFGNGPPRETDFDNARWFAAVEHPVSNIREVGAAIYEIRVERRAAVVRGSIVPDANRQRMVRRSNSRQGEPATLVAMARRWVGLEIENILCPRDIDPVFEPDAVVEHVILLLPSAFHYATSFWQFSSGHGIKPDIRLRLSFWFDRPVSDQELRRWLGEPIREDGVPPKDWKQRWPVDISLFHPTVCGPGFARGRARRVRFTETTTQEEDRAFAAPDE